MWLKKDHSITYKGVFTVYAANELLALFIHMVDTDVFYLNVTNLEGHEFVVWFWCPGINLHCILQSNH